MRDDGGVVAESSLPSGTVTFLFTDVEGSTRLWEEHPRLMQAALGRHDEILRSAVEGHGGYVFSTAGDSFAVAFSRAGDALAAATDIQSGLSAEPWPDATAIRVRVGVHTGEAQERGGDYFGTAVNRAARIMSAGHGGQVVVSSTSAAVVAGEVLVDLGEHRLRDLSARERLFQLGAGQFPALRTLELARHNLPVERTALVGRKAELDEVGELLTEHRLVTLLGMGGTGKTRLALALAAEIADEFADGVWFVDLVPATGGEQVAEMVATAAGLSVSGTNLAEALGELIADRRMLIVLDNCEHLTDEVADVVDVLLGMTNGPRFLATSREPLQLLDERQVHVAPLGVEADLASPAVELFAATAERVGVSVDPGEVGEIGGVCAHLDGLPLGIELAAAQLRHYSVTELLDRLDQRFELLATGRRGRGQRQASLQAVLDDTWAMLDDIERELLMLLAAFPAGFVAADVEQAALGLALGPVGSSLGGLVDRSLVARDGDGRHRLLETVKLYARQRWPEDAPDRYRDCHTGWVLSHLRSFPDEDRYTSAVVAGWASEHYEDWRRAEDRLANSQRIADLSELFSTLTVSAMWSTGPRSSAAIDRISRYLTELDPDDRQQGALYLYAAAAGLSCRRQDWIASGSDNAVRLFRSDGEPAELAWSLIVNSWMTVFTHPDKAMLMLEEAEGLADAAGAPTIADMASVYKANHLALGGAIDDASSLLEQILTRIEHRPFDRTWNEYYGVSASILVGSEPERARDIALTHHHAVRTVYGRDGIAASWFILVAQSVAATGDIAGAREWIEKAERAIRDDQADDGLPDLLIPMALLAYATGREDLTRLWITAVRRSPTPTHNFLITIPYRQLRNELGLLDRDPLEETTLEQTYEGARHWLASL